MYEVLGIVLTYSKYSTNVSYFYDYHWMTMAFHEPDTKDHILYDSIYMKF